MNKLSSKSNIFKKQVQIFEADRQYVGGIARTASYKEFKFDIDPDALIEDLPVGVQQRVEIIKALIYDAKVLILDEPTAVLTPQETDELLSIMRTLKNKGTSIIFIIFPSFKSFCPQRVGKCTGALLLKKVLSF